MIFIKWFINIIKNYIIPTLAFHDTSISNEDKLYICLKLTIPTWSCLSDYHALPINLPNKMVLGEDLWPRQQALPGGRQQILQKQGGSRTNPRVRIVANLKF